MNYRMLGYVLGRIFMVEAALLLPPSIVAVIHGEWSFLFAFVVTAVGLAVLSEPIIRLLARNYGPESVATAAPILAYLGIAVIFNSTVLLFNAIMQAHGDVTTPVVNMLIGGVVKVVVNYILVAIPSLNIIGAAIGTIVCYVTITVLDLIAMRRSVTTRPAIFRNVIRPAAAAGIMGAATFFAAALLRSFTDSNTVVCLGALIAAATEQIPFLSWLAFGRSNDAIGLLLAEEPPGAAAVQALDLFPVSSVKRDKNGGMEIHFFDRLKALTALYEYGGDADGKAAAHALLTALSGRPARARPQRRALTMAWQLAQASRPQRSTQALPAFRASAAASEVTLGRLS